MKTARGIFAVTILFFTRANLIASGPVGFYAVIEKVIFNPTRKHGSGYNSGARSLLSMEAQAGRAQPQSHFEDTFISSCPREVHRPLQRPNGKI